MDSQMMQLAMEQMSKMNPAQLQAMMRNLPPDAMDQAMSQMKNMKPDDWERMKQQMAGMDADTLARQAAQVPAQLAGRTQYILNASIQLKQEGNQLHNAGSYKDAVEKYERAKSNLESFTTKEAKDVIRACTLNLSSCYLNLQQYDKCLEQCNVVLADEPSNLKALYRRGQAYMGTASWLEASADLEKAVKLAAESDPAQAQLIRQKLQDVKDQIGALRASGKLPPASASVPKPAAASGTSGAGASASAELATAGAGASTVAARAASSSPASTSGSGSGSSAAGASAAVPSPDMLARASEMMRNNPEMLKSAQDMMRGMSDEQLRGMARQMGMDVSPEVMRRGMGDVDPDLLSKMAELQAELPPDLRGPDAARNPETIKRLADVMARKPELAATMGKMLSSMDPAKLQEMSRAAGLPAGAGITPELAKAAAESFQRMSPEEVQAAAQAMARMPPPPSAGDAVTSNTGRGADPSTSGPAGMPAVDPRLAADMLAAMTPEQLEAVAKMMPGGDKMQLTPDMAKMAAQMMKDMTPEDIERMQHMAAAAGMPGAGAGAAGAAGPGMAQMAADMMKNMTAEDMANMQEMAAKLGMGGPEAGPSGPGLAGLGGPSGGNDPMAAMLSDPKMIETAVRMMKNMDPESMVSMMMSSGMCRDRAQAEAMAKQMSGLSDTHVKMMVTAATAVQSARVKGQRALQWARNNILLVAAVLVVLLALLLRWLGYM